MKNAVGSAMVELVRRGLGDTIVAILDDSRPREIDRVSVELHTNVGELRRLEFPSVSQAVDFLNTHELQDVFITTDSPSLLDPAPDQIE